MAALLAGDGDSQWHQKPVDKVIIRVITRVMGLQGGGQQG